jgi:hypothetical protein
MQKFRKAVFIGINYPDSRSPLLNCINDARNMRDLIRARGGFEEHLFLCDDAPSITSPSSPSSENHNILPTKHNIFAAFDWLFDGVKEGDHLFIHYSGHGGSVRDPSRKEADGKNETLCNCDYEKVGEIIDDELNIRLLKRAIELGVHLFVITDSCHSGSNCDERFCMKEESIKPQLPLQPQFPQPQFPQPQFPQPQFPQPQFPQPQVPQYVIYQGKHYSYSSFKRNFIDPIDQAVDVLRKRQEHKLRLAYMPEYQRSRQRSRDRGLVDWFKKRIAELNEEMKRNPFIAHLMKTGIPIYPRPEYIHYATAALSIAFPPLAPVFGAIGAVAGVYTQYQQHQHNQQGVVGGVSNPGVVDVPPQQIEGERSARAIQSVKWSNTEDSKMPKYSGKGTFLKLSGCRDEQTSADGYNSRENGAMSGAILELFEKLGAEKIAIGDFLFRIRSKLMMHRFEQVPQMGSNSPIDSSSLLPL